MPDIRDSDVDECVSYPAQAALSNTRTGDDSKVTINHHDNAWEVDSSMFPECSAGEDGKSSRRALILPDGILFSDFIDEGDWQPSNFVNTKVTVSAGETREPVLSPVAPGLLRYTWADGSTLDVNVATGRFVASNFLEPSAYGAACTTQKQGQIFSPIIMLKPASRAQVTRAPDPTFNSLSVRARPQAREPFPGIDRSCSVEALDQAATAAKDQLKAKLTAGLNGQAGVVPASAIDAGAALSAVRALDRALDCRWAHGEGTPFMFCDTAGVTKPLSTDLNEEWDVGISPMENGSCYFESASAAIVNPLVGQLAQGPNGDWLLKQDLLCHSDDIGTTRRLMTLYSGRTDHHSALTIEDDATGSVSLRGSQIQSIVLNIGDAQSGNTHPLTASITKTDGIEGVRFAWDNGSYLEISYTGRVVGSNLIGPQMYAADCRTVVAPGSTEMGLPKYTPEWFPPVPR
jgi:hypothetical protein